jgi:hypothetical protein
VDFADDVALEASDDLLLAEALLGALIDVFASSRVRRTRQSTIM